MDFKSKRILITGGTGSFGNRVADYLESFNPKEILIFSRDEKKQFEMQKAKPDYHYIIGDIRDESQVDYAVRNADIIFHASALKQVPSCEVYPYEAVKTNVIGSRNLCDAATKHSIEAVVALSTDKAVKPINSMGISKAMMEKIVCSQNMRQHDTIFCCVRYGNVMGSRGSVIPLFKKQIEDQRKLTITEPNMRRFLMTLGQSVELVHYAFSNARGGEIFVKKAPACTVVDLAKTMLKKYGNGNLELIDIVGIRPGEKLDEVLVNEYEIQRAIEAAEFYTIPAEYSNPSALGKYPVGYEYTSSNTTQLVTYDEISNMLDLMGTSEYYT